MKSREIIVENQFTERNVQTLEKAAFKLKLSIRRMDHLGTHDEYEHR